MWLENIQKKQMVVKHGDHGSIRKKKHLKERQDYEFIRGIIALLPVLSPDFSTGFLKILSPAWHEV